MSLSHEEYRRTTVNLLPSQEVYIDQEAERRHTTKKQVITDLLATGIEVAQGKRLDDLYGEKVRSIMREESEVGLKRIEKEIHDSLFKTLYIAIKDSFHSIDVNNVAVAHMMAGFLSDVERSTGIQNVQSPETILESWMRFAENEIQKHNEKRRNKERN